MPQLWRIDTEVQIPQLWKNVKQGPAFDADTLTHQCAAHPLPPGNSSQGRPGGGIGSTTVESRCLAADSTAVESAVVLSRRVGSAQRDSTAVEKCKARSPVRYFLGVGRRRGKRWRAKHGTQIGCTTDPEDPGREAGRCRSQPRREAEGRGASEPPASSSERRAAGAATCNLSTAPPPSRPSEPFTENSIVSRLPTLSHSPWSAAPRIHLLNGMRLGP